MKRRHKRRRYLLWAAVSGLFFELLYRWATREPRWIQSYYQGITGPWSRHPTRGGGDAQ